MNCFGRTARAMRTSLMELGARSKSKFKSVLDHDRRLDTEELENLIAAVQIGMLFGKLNRLVTFLSSSKDDKNSNEPPCFEQSFPAIPASLALLISV